MERTAPAQDTSGGMEDIRAALSGDQTAYRRVVERHQDQVWRMMSRFSRNAGTIAELCQEVFVEAWLCLGKYRGRGPFGAWLRTLAVRTGYRHWREQDRRRAREADLPDHVWAIIETPAQATPSEAAETLYQFLERLGPQDRLVLTLAYWEGMDAREIAGATGWTHTLARVRMHRARMRLKKLVEAGTPQCGKAADSP